MEDKLIKAEVRENLGKGALKRKKNEGMVPGIFYKMGSKPISFICENKDLKHIEQYKTSILIVQVENKKLKGLVRDVQYDPLTDKIIHFDLMGIDLKRKVVVAVPTVLKGIPVGVKTSGGILEQINHSVEVECLPADIPEKIDIDVTEMNIGDAVHIGDMQIEKAKILSKSSLVIATVVPPTVIKEVVAAEAEEEKADEEEEPEVIQKDKEADEKKEG